MHWKPSALQLIANVVTKPNLPAKMHSGIDPHSLHAYPYRLLGFRKIAPTLRVECDALDTLELFAIVAAQATVNANCRMCADAKTTYTWGIIDRPVPTMRSEEKF